MDMKEKEFLLRLARDSITSAFEKNASSKPSITATLQSLSRPGASFVTLTIDGELRGCIGSLVARRPLAEDVLSNARSAAFEDPRFAPLTNDELSRVKIEVSVLSPQQRRRFKDPMELMTVLDAERPGVVLHAGYLSATFLPQVWEELDRVDDFLGHLCQKAGLSPNAWKKEFDKIDYSTYEVEKISER